MAIQIGNAFLGGNGFAFMLVIAFTVAIAILGTTLAAMNTGVRISFAMAQDAEMPDVMGLLHDKYATPFWAVVIMVIVSGIIGTIGVLGGVVALTGITLASNLGTFILYALICVLTTVAFAGDSAFSFFKHAIIPVLGFVGQRGDGAGDLRHRHPIRRDDGAVHLPGAGGRRAAGWWSAWSTS